MHAAGGKACGFFIIMADDLRERTISGMLWMAVQRFGRIGISFIGNLVLARLLAPEDFGYIGMLMVFIAIADTFVDSGFGAALIQRKEPTQVDYSTIFYWNLIVAFVFFGVFYVCAPWIADFYKLPALAPILRVQSTILILNAFSIIQLNQLIKQLEFKTLAKIHLIAAIASVALGIAMAYCGWGVWSLVIMNLSNAFILNIVVWTTTKWHPMWYFSWTSFKSLFNYGSLILIASLIETIYTHIQLLVVGRVFSAKVLGYFTQAQKMEEIPVVTLSQVVNDVTFSIYSRVQNEKQRLVNGLQKSIQAITFLSFPLMVLLIIIAPDLFRLLFTDKWSDSVPLFQMLCVAKMLFTINSTNVSAIKATGRSDMNLYANIIKKTLALLLMGFGVYGWGMKGFLWALVIDGFTHFLINAYCIGRLLRYGVWKQIKCVLPHFLLATILGILVYGISSFLHFHYVLVLLVQCIIYITLYLFLAYLFKTKAFNLYKEVVVNRFEDYNIKSHKR